MVILAHRANLEGPKRSRENSLDACREALKGGFGLETDLRRNGSGCFYVSHDPAALTDANRFDRFEALFREFPDRVIAMNVKELGYEADLIRLSREGALGGMAFYFDFELLEPSAPGTAQRRLRSLPGGEEVRLASRLSDRGESLSQCLEIPGEVVWADEFDSLWLTEVHVRGVHAAGRRFYAISPELHGFSRSERFRRWNDFKEWGIDGLCTDYSIEARDFFAG